MAIPREEVLKRLRKNIEQHIPIIGTGAGTGISAKFEEAGGTDLIIVYNSGRYRMAGRGSSAGLLAFGDANAIVIEMAGEILPVVKNTPVLAGINGTDPFKDMRRLLAQIKELGYSGVQNFPTVGLFEGRMRANLEETDLGYYKEVEMIRIARELDLVTTPYSFNPEEAISMVKAGADIIVAHVGCTVGGTIGASSVMTLDDAVKVVQDIHDAAVAENPNVIVLCHGGPIAEPGDAEYVLQHTKGVHGFYGASSAERLPVETALRNHINTFKSIKF
ncbi:MAG: phosphoenolpyruvate hydrolase family protein [Treponema sp.]|jgi:predicted TIM-barrel enzyme|nr:phosphoenolpyruvate hydrolase family protein [Treponema sp.]